MKLDFPSAEQFAASQGVRPILAIITGVFCAILLSKVVVTIVRRFTSGGRKLPVAVFVLFLAVVPWQSERFAMRGYEAVAAAWHSRELVERVSGTIAELQLRGVDWQTVNPHTFAIDFAKFNTALASCVGSRRPAKWFAGKRYLIRLVEERSGGSELSLQLLYAGAHQIDPRLPKMVVTFAATERGKTYVQEPILEFECPAITAEMFASS